MRVDSQDLTQRGNRHDDDFAWLGDASRHEHPLSRQQVQLSEKSPGTVPGDGVLLTVGANHDVSRSRHHHKEVVGSVSLAKEILAGSNGPSGTERVEDGDVQLGQGGKRDCVVSHPRRVPTASGC